MAVRSNSQWLIRQQFESLPLTAKTVSEVGNEPYLVDVVK